MSERDGYQPGVPCWVGTWQPDPGAAVSFYTRLFGWEAEDTMPPDSPGQYFVCKLRGRDVAAIGSQPPEQAGHVPVWATSETISLARRCGLETATRSGGHCFAGRSSTRGIVIDVSPMRSVSVSGGVATVGAGARLADLYDSLSEHGLTIPAGCGPSVGIAGLTLGGGLGVLGRKYGLTSDHLLRAQVVLADGSIIECDDHHDEELFWALRCAGGGNFGVLTSLTFNTIPAPDATCFHLLWPHTRAVAVIDAWQAWAPAAPDELAASLLVRATGDVEKPPVVNLFGAMLGTESDTAELLDELVAQVGAEPTSASLEHMSYLETKRYLA